MVITGARGTSVQFGQQLASEFRGPNNFTYWLLAIGIVGAAGYVQALQPISRMLMALIIISIFLSHKGFFANFNKALQSGPVAPNPLPNAPQQTATPTNKPGDISIPFTSYKLNLGGIGNLFGGATP